MFLPREDSVFWNTILSRHCVVFHPFPKVYMALYLSRIEKDLWVLCLMLTSSPYKDNHSRNRDGTRARRVKGRFYVLPSEAVYHVAYAQEPTNANI